MFTVDEKTTFVGLTDLRTQAQKMLKALQDSRVILTHRNSPCAVIIDYHAYQKMADLINMAEEAELAPLVKRRKRKNKGKLLSHDQVVNFFYK